ncbi:MAG: hypothetical protein ACFFD8_06110 [Candidatus Thorarchaeota archaeon]
MKRLKKAVNQSKYQTIVTGIFILVIVISGIGSIFLALDYVGVYHTTNQFAPRIHRVMKEAPDSTTRIISIELPLQNNGSELINIEGYAFIVYLNGQLIAYRETFVQIFIPPGLSTTLWGNFTFTGDDAQPIIDAELSDEWNWIIQYPIRAYIGGWLYVIFQHFTMPWTGVEEVS